MRPATGLTPRGPVAGDRPPAVDATQKGVDGLVVGDRLMAAGQYDLALEAYYRAAGEHGLTAQVLAAIGSADLKLGRLGQAETILRQAIKKDPTYVAAINNLGCVMMEKGNYGAAISWFKQAYALDSGNSDVIRQNLTRAIARAENSVYTGPDQTEEPQYILVPSGQAQYQLKSNH